MSIPKLKAHPHKHPEFKDDKKKSGEAEERFKEIKEVFVSNHDEKGVEISRKLLSTAVRYIECVVNADFHLQEARSKIGFNPHEYKEIVCEVDNERKVIHDALITNLKIANRYAQKKYGWKNDGGLIPQGGFFTLHHSFFHDRKQIAKWAWYLVSGIYRNHFDKLKIA